MSIKQVRFLLFLIGIQKVLSQNVISFQPNSMTIEVDTSSSFNLSLVVKVNRTITLNFTYGDENGEYAECKYIKPLNPLTFTQNGSQTQTVEISAVEVGHLVIGAKSDDIDIPFSDIFRLDIIHSRQMNIIIAVIGWIYFFAWSISFYPQVILNYRLKDVSGLSFDFISLNLVGHTCYLIFNVALYWFTDVQHEYFKIHPRGVNPVLLNDVLFSIHAVALTFITMVQVFYYKKGNKRISLVTKVILCAFVGFLLISGVVCAFTALSILMYIYFFSYVKLAITLMKYIPQAYTNFKRKSTVGWSILNVLLDFTGGILSLLQMFLLAYNYNDWTSIFGSPTKLGLGLFSIFFDILFIIQHYFLYNPKFTSENYSPIA